jgi:hypothetical protein
MYTFLWQHSPRLCLDPENGGGSAITGVWVGYRGGVVAISGVRRDGDLQSLQKKSTKQRQKCIITLE